MATKDLLFHAIDKRAHADVVREREGPCLVATDLEKRAESAERAVRDSLARIRAVMDALSVWLEHPDGEHWAPLVNAFDALADDDRRLLGMEG